MSDTTTSETRTVGRNGGTHASAVSKQLMQMGHHKFAQYDLSRGGYFCSNWGEDLQGGTKVKIEYRGPGRGLRGKPSEETVNRVRRAKLNEMAQDLRTVGYFVSWGWDEVSGDPDTSFIVASANPSREESVDPAEPERPDAEPEPLRATDSGGLPDLSRLLISIEQIEQAVLDITLAHNGGKPEVARRLEHALYHQVLIAVVAGSPEDPRFLAAAALVTQHLSFPR